MWILVGVWMFPEHNKIPKSNTTTGFSENVIPILTQPNRRKFQDEIKWIIDTIINNWIIDYLNITNQKNHRRNQLRCKRNIYELIDEAKDRVNIICSTLKLIESNKVFDREFVLKMINDLLNNYRGKALELLMSKFGINTIDESIMQEPSSYENMSQIKFDWIIYKIIDDWISDYIWSIRQMDTGLIRRKYYDDISQIYDDMLMEARAIEQTLFYIEAYCSKEEINIWVFHELLTLVVTEMLSGYRGDVFHLLEEIHTWVSNKV